MGVSILSNRSNSSRSSSSIPRLSRALLLCSLAFALLLAPSAAWCAPKKAKAGNPPVDAASFTDDQFVEFDPDDRAAMLLSYESLLDIGHEIDAVDRLDDGRVVISLGKKSKNAVDGQKLEEGDVFIFDPATGAVEVILSHDAFDKKAKVDALAMLDDRTLLLSTEKSATLAGVDVEPGDVVAYDVVDGTVEVRLSAASIDPKLNIETLSVMEDGSVLFSAAKKFKLDGAKIDAGDVMLLDLSTGVVEFLASKEDVAARTVVLEPAGSTGPAGGNAGGGTTPAPLDPAAGSGGGGASNPPPPGAQGQDGPPAVPALSHPVLLAFALIAAARRRIGR